MARPFRTALQEGPEIMKIPKTFIPKKDLEEKTKQLLKEPKKGQNETKQNRFLCDDLKKEFPGFTEYLSGLYPDLSAAKTKNNKGRFIWKFYIVHKEATSPFLVGKIERYVEECGKDMSEYGYHAKVLIEGNWHLLKYKIGYHCFDDVYTIISTKDPLRYDKEKSIPFP